MTTPRSRDLTRWSPPLLGREAALARLRAARLAAESGRGGIVAIEAPAGLGKTRLLAHARRGAAQTAMTVLAARATELEREFPFGVVRQLLDSLSDERRRRLDELLDGPAATARPLLSPDAAAPDADALAVLYGLYRAIVGLSAERPLLIAVDDAHWADLPSLRFLAFLAPRLEALPTLLVVAARPATGESRALLERLAGDPRAVRVALDPLDRDAVAELLASALAQPPAPAFAAACHRLAGGNPFLTCELARTAIALDVEPTADAAERVRGLLPESAARSVLARLADASDTARRLASAVAVLGDGCEPFLAGELAELGAPAVGGAADELRLRGILDPDAELRFLHPLVREAVHRDMPPGARDREHRRAARLLRRHGLAPDRIAVQLLATEPDGDSDGETVAALRTAATAALAQGAPQPAVAFLERALREPLDAGDRLDLLELLVTAAVRAARLDALAPHRAELEAALAREPARLCRVASDYATVLFGAGRRDDGLVLVERAVDAAVDAGDLHRAVMLDAQLSAYRQDAPRSAQARFERYGRHRGGDAAADRLTSALAAGWASQLDEPARTAASLARRALADGAIFDESTDAPPVTQAILVLARADELDAAIRAADRLISAATRRGSMVGLTSGWLARACAQRRADVAAAEADVRRAVEAARLAGFLPALPPLTGTFVDVLVDLDRLDEADSVLAEVELDGALPEGFWFDVVLFSRGRLRLAQGRPRDAADDLLELRERVAVGTRDFAGLPGDGLAAVALAQLGETARARVLAEEQLARQRAWGAPSAVAEGLVAFGTVVRGGEGLDALAEAVDLAEASPATLVRAAALVEHGALLLAGGARSPGLERLRAGLDIARRGGAIALARHAAAQLAAAGQAADRHTPIGASSLTPSERGVADLAMRGLTNREIAAARHVTVKTVESHLRAAYDKLGIASRRELPNVLPSR